ncbi:ParB/RepB/Spo0J family partition protein [Mediterraneibacter gnavus]
MKGRSASKIKLTSYDELLGGGEETNDIQQVSLEHLHSFENHPFQVNDDEAMAELVESVKVEGILTALLVRPLGDGEYEIIAGHRRRHAAQLAGLKEVPVIIRNMDQAWYADRDPNTNEPKTTAQMFFTVYYAEKGDKMLHHFKGKIDIGTGNGGLLSQLKLQK